MHQGAVRPVDPLRLGVLLQILGFDEIGGVEHVVRVLGALDLVQVGLGKEALVGEQGLVDRAQLVDAELGVGDAAAPAVPARGSPGERHQLDHLLEHDVAELDPVEQRCARRVEQVRTQRRHAEGVVDGLAVQVELRRLEAVVEQVEQGGDGLVQEGAVPGLLGGQGDQLQVAERFQAVALAVLLGAGGQVAQFRPGLDVEEEEQPVHVAQALEGEPAGHVAAIEFLLAYLAQVAHRLVAEQFDGLAQRVFQVFGNGKGVLVGVLVQGVEQRRAFAGAGGLPVEQGRGGLQGGGFPAVEDIAQVEAQEPLLVPLGAVEQQQLVGADQDGPARRLAAAEHLAGEDGFKGVGEPLFRVGLRRVLGLDGTQGERVGLFAVGLDRLQDPQLGRAVRPADPAQQRQQGGILVGDPPGVEFVAERLQQCGREGALEAQPFRRVAFPLQAGEHAEEIATQAPQQGGRLGGVVLLFPPFPLLEHLFQVVFQDGGQVVVGIELVFVGNAGDVDAHCASPRRTAITWMKGLSSVVMVSSTQWMNSSNLRSISRRSSSFLLTCLFSW